MEAVTLRGDARPTVMKPLDLHDFRDYTMLYQAHGPVFYGVEVRANRLTGGDRLVRRR